MAVLKREPARQGEYSQVQFEGGRNMDPEPEPGAGWGLGGGLAPPRRSPKEGAAFRLPSTVSAIKGPRQAGKNQPPERA